MQDGWQHCLQQIVQIGSRLPQLIGLTREIESDWPGRLHRVEILSRKHNASSSLPLQSIDSRFYSLPELSNGKVPREDQRADRKASKGS